MKLVGDIIEKDVTSSSIEIEISSQTTGFPKLYEPEKFSSWRTRLQAKKKALQKSKELDNENNLNTNYDQMSEAERIHWENIKLLNSMSFDQILKEKSELLDSLNPNVLQSLINRVDKKLNKEKDIKDDSLLSPFFTEIEGGFGNWIGGTKEFPNFPRLDDAAVDRALGIKTKKEKNVKFQDESDNVFNCTRGIKDEDDIAIQEYQFVQKMDHMSNEELLKDVHFLKIKKSNNILEEFEALDIYDANFNEKLHEKYFPDLPKEIEKTEWFSPISSNENREILDDVSECRFDFKGNLVPLTREIKNTFSGLHHHSDKPELAGYTISELEYLSRSTFSPQRCIAIQTLGRILYKLGKQNYYQITPEVDLKTYKEEGGTEGVTNRVYAMFWDLLKSTRVIESLKNSADETKTKSLNVRNYAIDALWLWKQGGGDFRTREK